MRKQYLFPLLLIALLSGLAGCKKETIIVTDNDPPYYDEIPTNIVQNYVNRMYIDLIGREPLNSEMTADVQFLKDNDLSADARETLLSKLQFSTDFIAGDSSYNHAYYHRFYDLSKVSMMEGASNGEIRSEISILLNAAVKDSLNGDSVDMYLKKARAQKYQAVIDAEHQYRLGQIEVAEMHARMVDNGIYDMINMNTFNFINATFDDFFGRFPTANEYDNAFEMIEYNRSGLLFGKSGQNKGDYIAILVDSREYYEGLIRRAYLTLLAREPATAEVANQMNSFYYDHDFQKVQRAIMVTDEYANF